MRFHLFEEPLNKLEDDTMIKVIPSNIKYCMNCYVCESLNFPSERERDLHCESNGI